jgi:hypothetical protein
VVVVEGLQVVFCNKALARSQQISEVQNFAGAAAALKGAGASPRPFADVPTAHDSEDQTIEEPLHPHATLGSGDPPTLTLLHSVTTKTTSTHQTPNPNTTIGKYSISGKY